MWPELLAVFAAGVILGIAITALVIFENPHEVDTGYEPTGDSSPLDDELARHRRNRTEW